MAKTYQVKFETQYCWNQFTNKGGLGNNTSIRSLSINDEGMPFDIQFKKTKTTKKKTQIWDNYWLGLPLFTKEKGWYHDIKITFDSENALQSWLDIHGCDITGNKSFWYSPRHHRYKNCYITSDNHQQPEYTIYIPSKSRHDCCKTADSLIELGVKKFFIIVEQHQFDNYANYYPKERLLVLPQSFLDDYETLDNLGDSKSKGPGAARNFAWWHSINVQKETSHWVFDDNATGFVQFAPGNFRIPIKTPTFLKVAEDFYNRFDGVAQLSLNYRFFVVSDRPAFTTNTRAYSFILQRNDVPFRWRGRYNEDTILSIDCMEAGWKTIMLNQFLANKAATQTLKGGNTEEFYAKEGTTNKSQMLYDVYPQFTNLVERWGRPHHHVDYVKHWGKSGKKLTYKEDYQPPTTKIDSYGLYLKSDVRDDVYPQCLI